MAPGPFAVLRFTKVHFYKTWILVSGFIKTEHSETRTTLQEWNLFPVCWISMFFCFFHLWHHTSNRPCYVSLACLLVWVHVCCSCCRLPLCRAELFASLKTPPLLPITQWFVYHEWNSRFGVAFPVTLPLTTVFPSLPMFSLFPGFGPITPLHLFATSYTNTETPPRSLFDFPACACLPHSRLTFCCGLLW